MILQATDLGCTRAAKPVLQGCTLQLLPGEVLGIVGPNGAGKSSLLMTLACLLPQVSGALRLADADLRAMPPRQRARLLGYLPQRPVLAWPLSVRELVSQGRFPHAAQPGLDAQRVDAALARVGLTALADRAMDTLSGGEQARAHLARLLAGEHAVLLCDEPVAALDPYHQLAFLALLRELAAEGRAVALVLHDLPLAASFCHRLLVMDSGRIDAEGAPRAVLDDALLERIFGVRGVRDDAGDLLALRPLA